MPKKEQDQPRAMAEPPSLVNDEGGEKRPRLIATMTAVSQPTNVNLYPGIVFLHSCFFRTLRTKTYKRALVYEKNINTHGPS